MGTRLRRVTRKQGFDGRSLLLLQMVVKLLELAGRERVELLQESEKRTCLHGLISSRETCPKYSRRFNS